VSFYYVRNFGFQNLAIVKAIIGSPIDEVMEARSSMTNNFSGKLHWIKLFNVEIFSFVLLIFWGYSIVFKSYKSKFLFVISFIVLSFNLLMSSEKGLVMDLLLMLILMYYFIRIDKINVKKLSAWIFLILFIILMVVYKIFMDFSFDSSLILAITSRIFGVQIDSAYYYVEYFNMDHSFLYGASFPNPGGLLPFTQFNLTQEIQNWKFPELLEFNILGSMPTIFWAEAYANYGYLGVVFVSVLIGSLLCFIDFFAIKSSRNIIGLAFYIYLVFHYKNLAVTGISNFMVDINLIVVLIVFFIITKLRLNPPQGNLSSKT
jgi:oligosaccharide repeat unit polymerase